jgi:hypothetical protein
MCLLISPPTPDVAALVDLSRCGESTAIVALLTAALLLPHAYWFTVVGLAWEAGWVLGVGRAWCFLGSNLLGGVAGSSLARTVGKLCMCMYALLLLLPLRR